MAAKHQDMYEFEAVVNVALPDGGTFPADMSGSCRADDWDDAVRQVRYQTDIDGSRLKRIKLTKHCSSGRTVTRYDEWPDAHLDDDFEPEACAWSEGEACTYKDEPADSYEFYWFGGCAGVRHVHEDPSWHTPGEYPKEEVK